MSRSHETTFRGAIAAVIALLVLAGPAVAAQEQEPAGATPAAGQATATAPPSGGAVIATSAPGTAAATASQEAMAPRPPRPRTYTLQVTILRAREGEPSLPDLPDDAVAALRDLQGLTRFRHFELVDTGWIRTQEAGQARLGEAGAFEVYAALGPRDPQPAGVSAGSTDDEGERVVVRHFEVGYWEWEKDEESGRIYHAQEPIRLLSSTFALDVDETVVVGTSRLTDGDEALVVLVKATRR